MVIFFCPIVTYILFQLLLRQNDFKFKSSLNNLVKKHGKINSIKRNSIITQNRVFVALPEAMGLIPHTLEDDRGDVKHSL